MSAGDIDIQADIENAFRRSILIDEQRIKASVNNGVVTLTGNARNYPEKNEALDIAMYTAIVINVMDKVTVE